MTKFKPGDRIAVYGLKSRYRYGDTSDVAFGSVLDRTIGAVTNHYGDIVSFEREGCQYEVHEKQCRKLVKKTERKPVRMIDYQLYYE